MKLRTRSASRLPVLLAFPDGARMEGWGRFIELSASTATLSTHSSLVRLERVLLTFELNGENFAELPARVAHQEPDQDGYTLAELTFTDEVAKRRLARVLADLLSRA